MPVRDWMSKDLITIDEDASIMKASKLMKQNNIQHLVVLRKGRLVGIVSLGDIALSDDPGRFANAALCGISEPGGEHSQGMDRP